MTAIDGHEQARIDNSRETWRLFPLDVRRKVVEIFRRQKIYGNESLTSAQYKGVRCCPFGVALLMEGDPTGVHYPSHNEFLPTSSDVREHLSHLGRVSEDVPEKSYLYVGSGASAFIARYYVHFTPDGEHLDLSRLIPLED